jgi:thiol-disulfide isomerase/thioredoxin
MLLAALSAFAFGQAGSPAPELALKDIRGRTLRLSDYRGKVVLLNFWATWCAPCRAEMPDLVKWQREHKSRGLQVIGVTYPPQELAEVRQFIRSIKVNYPVAMGREETKALFDKGETLPVTVVIDRKGTVRGVIQGILYPEEFEQVVKPLLQQ